MPDTAFELDSDPTSVEKETTTPFNGLPFVSDTTAVIAVVPPLAPRRLGFAVTCTCPAAAPPTVIVSGFELVSCLALPEVAMIFATPDWPFGMNWAAANPLTVRALTGETVPRFVEKVTVVPFWTGVPDDSSTIALTSAAPFACTIAVLLVKVTVEPDGARSGTLSHPAAARATAVRSGIRTVRFFEAERPVMIESIRQ